MAMELLSCSAEVTLHSPPHLISLPPYTPPCILGSGCLSHPAAQVPLKDPEEGAVERVLCVLRSQETQDSGQGLVICIRISPADGGG